MARLSRIVIPGVAHHVTQRGNRRFPVSFSDPGTKSGAGCDRREYLRLMAEAAAVSRTRCLAGDEFRADEFRGHNTN